MPKRTGYFAPLCRAVERGHASRAIAMSAALLAAACGSGSNDPGTHTIDKTRVVERVARLEKAVREDWEARHPGLPFTLEVTPRFVLLHTLAHALIRVESNYNPLAISRKGAMGLMQLMPATAQQYGVRDPFDPLENLEAGMRHLRYLMDRFDPRRAIAAYNAGEGAVRRYGAVPPYRETQNYVQRILAIFQGG